MTVVCVTTAINAPIERCFDLSLSIELELEAAKRYRIRAIGGRTSGQIGLGETVRWQTYQFGIAVTHESEISRLQRPAFFQDRMVEGIFQIFEHDHVFRSVGRTTEMRDVLRFSMPGWLVGFMAEKLVVERRLRRLITERNSLIKQRAEAQQG